MPTSNKASHRHGTIATTLTNPGIIDRLEQDIDDYLSPFGFSLERQIHHAQEEGVARTDSTGGRAVLTTPRLYYSYASNHDGGISTAAAAAKAGEDALPPLALAANVAIEEDPIGTLHLHIYHESLLSTVGPLLRTFLRLFPHSISPLRLRSVIHCHFVLDALGKFEKMNSKQKRNQLLKQEEICAKRMAHRVHMLVRNSMGSALCLELVVILPCYWRRKIIGKQDAATTSSESTTSTRLKVPLSVDSVVSAMRANPDACYPSVQLVERTLKDGVDGYDDGDGSRDLTGGPTSIHLDVRTRMCTVRHQPLMFRWISSLEFPMTRPDNEPEQCNVSMYSGNGLLTKVHPSKFVVIEKKMPLIVACIEKVANLHRILMLCHDYDESSRNSNSIIANDGYFQSENGGSSQSSVISNVIVILPNNSGEQKVKTLREFDKAIDHFHNVMIALEKDHGHGYSHRYRPTLIHEDHAAEKITDMIELRRSSNKSPKQPNQPSIAGIDLHPDALTLHGDYASTATRNKASSPALRMIRDADAIVFGYESEGIPDSIAGELNGWAQIPSRSSINVVAAMSIVFDAVLGAGAGGVLD